MEFTSTEAKIILALEAIKKDPKLSLRMASKIYGCPYTTLRRREGGTGARGDTTPNSRRLTDLEEETIVDYIIDLNTRAFPPRLSGVEDMANQLLRDRGVRDSIGNQSLGRVMGVKLGSDTLDALGV